MKTLTIIKTKDQKRIYKIEPMKEPIIYCGTTYGYIETLIFDGIAVCQRLLEKNEIYFELDIICADISRHDRLYSDFYEE